MIINSFKTILKKIVKYYLKDRYYNLDGQAHPSFSQMGEDMILRKLFEEKKYGFYVDVGAYHPKQYSNTYYFYINGWSGINIDAMPNSMGLFNEYRPRDINLEVAISDKKESKEYYTFDQQPALNTFLLKRAEGIGKTTKYKIQKRTINTRSLEEILDKYLPKNVDIDFLTIDVEGMDYQALNSNNWNKYSPKVIVIEDDDFSYLNLQKSRTYRYLIEKGYNLIAKTDVSLIFNRNNSI